MRKLILAVAILTSGFSANAFVNNNLPIETFNITVADDFTEVTLDKLPETITNAVKKDYANATLVKAFTNTKEQYKLELKIKETISIVYTDNDGNWLEEAEVTNTPKK